MRTAITFLALTCASLALSTSCRRDVAAPTTTRPNVLFISIDTLRADFVGAYGATRAKTPSLDALAERGVLFENAVAHVPMTLPSHASMFTSLIPPRHGVRDNGTFVLGHQHQTLAELLSAAGYHTGAFVGAFVLDAQFGLDQGFDVYDDDVEGTAENDRRSEAVLRATRAWLDGLEDDEPWFAFVHLFDPHAPYEAPAPYGHTHASEPYAGEVAYVDHAVGEFLRSIEALDETLVIITADHGEGLGEHGERTHGMFGYDSTLRVPLILHWPEALPRGQRVRSRVRHIDIAPTVAELVGIPVPESFQGRSLTSSIGGNPEPDRTSYFESFTYTFNYGSAPLRGLYHDHHKLVALPLPELYDLAADPRELDNIAASRAATARALADRLEAMSAAPGLPATVSDAERERLESLGYISAANPIRDLSEYGPADDPKNWVHLANMLDEAVAEHRARRPAEAIALLRAIIAEKGNVAIAYTRLARILHEEGRSYEAIAVLEDALASGVDNANIVTALGLFLRQEGDEAGWTRVLEGVVARHPGDVDAHEALAASLMRRGLAERALTHLERVVALEPTHYGTLVQMALALEELGRVDEARIYLERFVTDAPNEIYAEDKTRVEAFIDELNARAATP